MMSAVETLKPGKRESQKEARRAAIIDAAMEAFFAHGFIATKLDDVAERAGIGKGTIYLYFSNKEHLFEEVVRTNLFPIRDAAEAHVAAFTGSAAELLTSHFHNMYAALANPNVPPLVSMIFGEALRFPAIADFFYEEIIRKSHEMLRGIISRGVNSGEFRPDAEQVYIHLLVSPILMSVTWNQTFMEKEPIQMDDYISKHIDSVLRMLRA
jgi:AcrR family transcriptional regulator